MIMSKTAESIDTLFRCGLGWAQETVLDGDTDQPMQMGNFGENGQSVLKYRDSLPRAVQEWLSHPCAVAMWPFCQITLTTC